MHVIEDVWGMAEAFPRVVLTVGSFDGVHLGHRRILDEVVQEAGRREGTAAVLTMRPHPRRFFAPERAPNLLTTDAKKLALFEAAGVDAVFFLPFTEETAGLDPREFVARVVRDRCRSVHVVVGHDFRFGRGAVGDFDLLASLGPAYGFTAQQVDALLLDGERVSSTVIRELLLEGDLEGAEAFLGRKYSLAGEVVPGRGVGRKLGFPTANVLPHVAAVPAHGVYAAEAIVEGVAHVAAVNIGIAPTIRQEDVVVEAFLLDYDASLVGKSVEIVFHRRLRPERKFASPAALVQQINRDVADIRAYMARRS
ncbi:MAG TPA: bifunctional riboflavin kinase/FAD synthetase [Candidatus Hydrogenedentes bacterium]|nr:bifunctional riboflavin kinase/FAD synthetase [Candidatus Hydrogenedentota bacterium]